MGQILDLRGNTIKADAVEAPVTGGITGDITGDVTGDVTGNVTGYVIFPEFEVSELPAAAAGNEGQVVFVSDGNAGQETLARSDGTNWVSLATGATVSAT